MTATHGFTETPGTWTLAPARSSVGFMNKTLWGLVKVNGEFSDLTGEGRITTDGTVCGRVDIGVASLRTGIGKRDEHLRAADYFDAAVHPAITVVVTGVDVTGERTADVRADITVRGVTRPLPLTATVDQLGDGAVRVSAQTTVDRTTFGVGGNPLGMLPTATRLSAVLVFTAG